MNGCSNSTDVGTFFDKEWELYNKVITLNYMAHREVLEILRKFFHSVPSHAFSVLELGCGDASLLSSALQGTKIETYCGVDLSHYALTIAEDNMRLYDFNKCFIEGDLLEEVGSFRAEFDIIVAGYSFHHLIKDEKVQFFKKCRAALKSQGVLILYDEVCNPGENRHGFIKRFSRICTQEWSRLIHEEISLICDHVEKNDYPETFEFYKQLAQDNGFRDPQMLFHDKHNLYGVFRFTT